MSNEPPEKPSFERPRRIIKRYSNRKLYDTRDSRYVTLLQIAEMVRAGEDVQIIDNASKEDKTEVTLALIISEELKSQPRSVPLGTLRDLIHQRGEKLLSHLREGPIGRLIPGVPGEGRPEGELDPAATPETTDVPAAAPVPADGRPGGSDAPRTDGSALEQWRRVVDERIRTALVAFSPVRELQSRIDQLTKRVSDLEAELARRRGE
ncbi:MAG TPA: polyhydroxyalkanoate synthesis regulator DNA-binding domain-containing protein [Polyangiaceae bacterium]